MKIDSLLERFEGVKPSGSGWTSLCPSHRDKQNSLSISTGEDGRILLHCHAGCATESICHALGIGLRDLFSHNGSAVPAVHAPARPCGNGSKAKVFNTLEALIEFYRRKAGATGPEILYAFKWPDGRLHGYELRFPVNGGKWVRPVWQSPEGWRLGDPPGPWPLYRSEAIPSEGAVCVLEGPKCADLAASIGIHSVASAHGAGAAKGTDWTPLAGRKVIILPDAGKAGEKYAGEVAGILTRLDPPAQVKIVRLPGLADGEDIEQWLQRGGSKADLFTLCKNSPTWTIAPTENVDPGASMAVENPEPDPLQAEIQHLAALSDIEYDRERKDAAKRLNIRVGTLDAERNRLRGVNDKESKQLAFLADPEPWPDPVDGADLLDDLAGLFSKYIVLPKGGAEALALWTVFTFAHDCFPVCPMLSLQSAEKQSGKTTTLAILSAVCRKPLPLSNISAAATFRVIEKYQPTLILDESETYLRGDNEELRGILNSGHTRPTAFVIRCNGDSLEPEIFSTWTPKAFGLIGTLPDTLADRSIILPMARKKPGDSVERNRLDTLPEETEPLRARAARWAMDNTLRLRAADPESIPEGLNDRAQDNWRPLLAIADTAGRIWPGLARKIALTLRGESDADSIGSTLLKDIQMVFDQTGSGYLSSEHLCKELSQMEAQPWAEWRHGKPITPAGVARRLKNFGIKPKVTRTGADLSRGYNRVDFADAWERYISP